MQFLSLSSLSALSLACACAASVAHAQAPNAADPNQVLNQFEATFGKFEGYRRSGAKGICAMGEFVGSEEARGLSISSAFSGKPVPVVIRFSVGGANPKAPDNARTQRNFALQLNLPGGEQWQMGNISAPVFGARSPQQFVELLASRQPDPNTKQADPAKVRAFNDANPEILLLPRHLASQPVPASFASVNYWGVHGFGFVNASGAKQFGKWVFEPIGGQQSLSDDEAKAKGPSFLFDELRARVKAGKVGFQWHLELAEAADNINNATVPLPAGRKKVKLGDVMVTSVADDAAGPCLGINFNPMNLPKGIEPSADPMLAGRAAPYAVGLSRRLGEGAKQQ